MEKYIKALEAYADLHLPDEVDSVLMLLYEAWNDHIRMDTDEIKADFAELYQLMNGMSLQDMDKILYPVCTLCRDHEKAGFSEGVKVGLRLWNEIR